MNPRVYDHAFIINNYIRHMHTQHTSERRHPMSSVWRSVFCVMCEPFVLRIIDLLGCVMPLCVTGISGVWCVCVVCAFNERA